MARIVLKDLHKHFGKVRAVDGINLMLKMGNSQCFWVHLVVVKQQPC